MLALLRVAHRARSVVEALDCSLDEVSERCDAASRGAGRPRARRAAPRSCSSREQRRSGHAHPLRLGIAEGAACSRRSARNRSRAAALFATL